MERARARARARVRGGVMSEVVEDATIAAASYRSEIKGGGIKSMATSAAIV